jgi:mono/diheme cytochrome c family protein
MKVKVFLDDDPEPLETLDPPTSFELDTTSLPDGRHRLRIEAFEDEGPAGRHEIPFTVRNGPGIAVFGLAENDVVHGRLPVLVNAYSGRPGDRFEPVRAETPAPVPTWAWVLALVVAAWAIWYATREYQEYRTKKPAAPAVAEAPAGEEGAAAGEAASKALGEQVYGNYCSACHQLTGKGVPAVFPPLEGNAVVLAADPAEHVRTVLQGLQGKTIGGVTYTSQMPAFGNQLNDEQVAAVINHERTSWGNAAPTVEPGAVAALR